MGDLAVVQMPGAVEVEQQVPVISRDTTRLGEISIQPLARISGPAISSSRASDASSNKNDDQRRAAVDEKAFCGGALACSGDKLSLSG